MSSLLAAVALPSLASRPPLPPLYGALPTLILLLLAIAPPSRLLTLALLPPLVFSALWVPLAYTTGNVGGDFGIGTQGFIYLLTWLDRFVITPNYETVFLRSAESAVPPPWSLARCWYAYKLNMSMRGAGWKWEVRNVPSASTAGMGHGRFLATRLARTAGIYLAVDVLSTYQQRQPYFHRLVPLSSLSDQERILSLTAAAAISMAAIALLYNALCVVCVATTLWTPSECPDLFGPLSSATTLQGFWGRCWHQSFRRCFTTPSHSLSSLLTLPPRSPSAKLLTGLTSFGLSAPMHAFGMYAMARTGSGAARFFLLQPLGIGIELAAISLTAKAGLGGRKGGWGWSVVGMVWTAAWLLATCPSFFDELVQAGMWTVDPAPLSVVKGVLYGRWWNP